MKNAFAIAFFLIPFLIFSQDKFSKEFSFVTDNDLYVSFKRDRYYTNGMFLNYRYIKNTSNDKLAKKIFEWQLGHEMFTPYKAIVTDTSDHDRPFAGYLYGGFSIKNVYKENKILNYGVQIGIVGPNAYGQELQEFIHNIYGFQKAEGWKHQIQNALGFNLGASYIQRLATNESKTFDLNLETKAQIGTIYTDISAGLNLRLGFIPLQDLMNTIAYNTNLNNKNTIYKREGESFFYIKPMVRYALYDATLQGSFLNKGSEVTKELIPVVFDMEVGLKFTANRFNFGYAFNYNTSKSEDLRYTYGNKYGTIIVSYLIR
ncbi:lipid A deacylase LpxR family protein [Polaribacter sp. P097]|uniref:lipid A deacylase LpxR family protein n=1 Tax=Polaribacter sp. P097 TaxID=3117398 RepID=UPI002FE16DC4